MAIALEAEEINDDQDLSASSHFRKNTKNLRNSVSTEGFFDVFKKKEVIKKEEEKEKTLDDAFEELTEKINSLKQKMLKQNSYTAKRIGNLQWFPSIKSIIKSLNSFENLINFYDHYYKNLQKAHIDLLAAAKVYADTLDTEKLHLTYQKILASYFFDTKGFDTEFGETYTVDIFQSIFYSVEEYVEKNDLLFALQINQPHSKKNVNKEIDDNLIKQVVTYDFPNLPYIYSFTLYKPKSAVKQPQEEISITKAEFSQLLKELINLQQKANDLYHKYNFDSGFIGQYIDQFEKLAMQGISKHGKSFNHNGFYRIEDNFYSGRYNKSLNLITNTIIDILEINAIMLESIQD